MQPAQSAGREAGHEELALRPTGTRRALSVFFLSGLLMAFPGAILPAWRYHIHSDFSRIGMYFLSMGLGVLAAAQLAPSILARRGVRFASIMGSALACGGFVSLALSCPPVSWWWRLGGVLVLGFSFSLLVSVGFHSSARIYRLDRAATTNLAGILFGAGSFVIALLVSGTFYVYTVPSILVFTALIPGFAAGLYARSQFQPDEPSPEPPWRQVWADIRSPGAVLFTLLLFFQFGNECTVAGWLPVFLAQRIGISPERSLTMLAFFWLFLVIGRVMAQALLARIGHGKLLGGSVLSELLGCLILISTHNAFGAWTGVVLLGGGFAVIYPLVLEKIGHRFPHYHPGLLHRLFSFASLGGLLAPWSAGLFADWWGVKVIMGLPLLGSAAVCLLLVLLWVETRLTTTAAPAGP